MRRNPRLAARHRYAPKKHEEFEEPVRFLTEEEVQKLRSHINAALAQVERDNNDSDPFAKFMEAGYV